MEPSGWMTYGGFVEWLKFFINRVGCTPKRKDLFILDGHITHVKSIAAIELARSNEVVMIRLPPHCTHRMQPGQSVLVKSDVRDPFMTYLIMQIRHLT